MSEVLDDPITKRTEEEINISVGNDSRKQERAGERNDKSYNQIEEKSDYEIYNPALIRSISFSIPAAIESSKYVLRVGAFYPISVTVNSSEGDKIANVPQVECISFRSNDMTKAYVQNGNLYAIGATEEVQITGVFSTIGENGETMNLVSTITASIS